MVGIACGREGMALSVVDVAVVLVITFIVVVSAVVTAVLAIVIFLWLTFTTDLFSSIHQTHRSYFYVGLCMYSVSTNFMCIIHLEGELLLGYLGWQADR